MHIDAFVLLYAVKHVSCIVLIYRMLFSIESSVSFSKTKKYLKKKFLFQREMLSLGEFLKNNRVFVSFMQENRWNVIDESVVRTPKDGRNK